MMTNPRASDWFRAVWLRTSLPADCLEFCDRKELKQADVHGFGDRLPVN